jgi:predicted component of type VI protein secretion system
MNYYSIPLQIEKVRKGLHLEQVDVRKSIHQQIALMLKTLTLSYRFDPVFGSILNKYHAQTPPQRRSQRLWMEEMRERIQKNLLDLLVRYETRITVTDVFVDLVQPNPGDENPLMKVRVRIQGNLSIGRKEKFHYPDNQVDEDAQEAFPLLIPVGKII